MDLKSKIFLQLYTAKGTPVSGEWLAKELSVSRMAICKAVNALRQEGYDITSRPHEGYTLCSVGKRTADEIDERFLSLACGCEVVRFSTVPSTNDYALSYSAPLPFLIVADSQEKGKARHHAAFPSPENGIYFSYACALNDTLLKASLIPALATKIVAEVTGGEARENRVYLGEELIAGVLVEMVADFDSVNKLVIGVGIYPKGIQTDKTNVVAKIVTTIKEKL